MQRTEAISIYSDQGAQPSRDQSCPKAPGARNGPCILIVSRRAVLFHKFTCMMEDFSFGLGPRGMSGGCTRAATGTSPLLIHNRKEDIEQGNI